MNPSVGDVINKLTRRFNVELSSNTVDTLKTGDASWQVTGIISTFMATLEVIEKAIAKGVNMIITHEPTFYHHSDDAEHIKDTKMYLYKRKLLEDNRIAILRIHDSVHLCKPDNIIYGVAGRLGWNNYADKQNGYIFNVPETTVLDLIQSLKDALKVRMVRYIGKPEMKCKRIGLLVGACGGARQIKYLDRENIDVLICGEATEWETVEYVRDALAIGMNTAILILGHANSEEAGMEYMAGWLRNLFPELPVTFIPAGDPFSYL